MAVHSGHRKQDIVRTGQNALYLPGRSDGTGLGATSGGNPVIGRPKAAGTATPGTKSSSGTSNAKGNSKGNDK